MLLTPNKVVKVSELITGLAVGSANDAAIALAENIAGTESKFTDLMNAHARRLGLGGMQFRNATGFQAEGQSATLHDLVQLTAHLIATYPDLYALFGQKDMPYGRNRQANRNPLITMEIGADGVMTGSVPEFGHLIIGSAVQEGRRLIVGIAGTASVQERALEARKLLEWGFRRFEIRALFPPGAEIGAVSVYGGEAISVPVRSAGGVRLPVLRGAGDALSLRIAYRGPVRAPIKANQVVARLEVLLEGRVIQTSPLQASRDIAQGSVLDRARDASLELSRQGLSRSVEWLLETLRLKKRPAEATVGNGQAG